VVFRGLFPEKKKKNKKRELLNRNDPKIATFFFLSLNLLPTKQMILRKEKKRKYANIDIVVY